MSMAQLTDDARSEAEAVAVRKWGNLRPIPLPEPQPARPVGNPVWHIALIERLKAETVAEALIYGGFEIYHPTFVTSVRQNYFKRRNVWRPFFPGYLFVRFDEAADREWRRIYAVRGIAGMMERTAEQPAVVPDHAIAIVRAKEAELQTRFEASAKSTKKRAGRGKIALPFKIGDAVEVDDEVWRYQVGRIEKLDDRGRITVLMSLFGRVTPIEVSANQVRAL